MGTWEGREERRQARLLERARRRQTVSQQITSQLQAAVASLPSAHADLRAKAESILAQKTQVGYPQLAAHWAAAIAKWCKAGCPTRTREERERIYAICRACPSKLFDHENQSCKVCGCAVKTSLLPINDKAAMATEKCAKKHWP